MAPGKLCILNISVLAERVVLYLRYIKSMGKLSTQKDILARAHGESRLNNAKLDEITDRISM